VRPAKAWHWTTIGPTQGLASKHIERKKKERGNASVAGTPGQATLKEDAGGSSAARTRAPVQANRHRIKEGERRNLANKLSEKRFLMNA